MLLSIDTMSNEAEAVIEFEELSDDLLDDVVGGFTMAAGKLRGILNVTSV